MAQSPLAEVLACPSCKASLVADASACGACGVHYPAIDGIPWLLPQPVKALAEWHLRLRHMNQRLEGDAESLKLELKDPKLSELTGKRLRKLLQAKVEQRKTLGELLAPLDLAAAGSEELSRAMNIRVPLTQSITSYFVNIHRDWGWETAENQACLDAVLEALPAERWQGKRVLVLGAGYGRLTYDLHQRTKPALTVATDINPLMLIAAKKIFKGKNVKLYEFPLAPKDLENHSVLRKCAADEAASPGLELVFGDALTPPFAASSFDIVLTPWLIDILPPSLPLLAATINRLLKPGGTYVNFGSLGFNHALASDNLSLEEVMETVAGAGFAVAEPKRRSIPYMQSPASAHARVELVTTFAATKTADVPPSPAFEFLPPWLAKNDVPVPRIKTLDAFVMINSILLDTVAMVDGKRTLAQIAELFGKRHGLPVAEAEFSVKGFLVKQFEQSQQGKLL